MKEHVLTAQELVAQSMHVAEDLQNDRGTSFLQADGKSVNNKGQRSMINDLPSDSGDSRSDPPQPAPQSHFRELDAFPVFGQRGLSVVSAEAQAVVLTELVGGHR